MRLTILSAGQYARDGWGRLGQPLRPVEWAALPRWPELFSGTYDRFPRLDPLSKVAAIAAELVLSAGVGGIDNLAVMFVTAAGCLQADLDYYRTAMGSQPELASPKIFPYTLPSAAVAEICIRHGIHGPGLVFWGQQDLGPGLLQIADGIAQGEMANGLLLAADAVPGQAAESYAFLLGPAGSRGAWTLGWDPCDRVPALPAAGLAQALRFGPPVPGWRVDNKEA